MSTQAKAYICITIVVGIGASLFLWGQVPIATVDWLTFMILALMATATHLIKVEGSNHEAWHFNLSFFLAGVLLLPPALFILLVIVPHSVEWIKEGMENTSGLQNWYIQPFNIGTHILSGTAAYWIFTRLNSDVHILMTANAISSITLAAVAYLIINHALIGQALVLARNISWEESGVMSPEGLISDLAVLMQGFVVAFAWRINPLLIAPVLSSLVLMYRGLFIHKLQQEARIDDKTGLWNTRHFKAIFKVELEKAQQLEKPLSIIMADLDFLRNVNDQHGHLAGDLVLTEVGKLIRENIGLSHTGARAGGEEFCILMPGTEVEEAWAIAEKIRSAIEHHPFPIPNKQDTLHVTISMGLASFPADADEIDALVHQADMALYEAKSSGRNRIHCASPISICKGVPENISSPHQSIIGLITGRGPCSQAESVTGAEQRSQKYSKETKFAKLVPVSLICGVILSGLIATGLSLWFATVPNWTLILFLCMLGFIIQFLQIPMYGEMSVSASMAVVFGAALLSGIPGVSGVSLAIAIAHGIRRRPTYYKFLYNWAVHVLAGLVPALLIQYIQIPFEIFHLHLLIFPILLSSFAYYYVETGLIAAAISITQNASFITTWKEQFKWLAGHYLAACIGGLFLAVAFAKLGWVGLLAFALPIFMMHYAQKQYSDHTRGSVKELRRMNQELSAATEEIEKANESITQMNHELFQTLAYILDARDPYVHNHSLQVGEYATAIAERLGLSPTRIEHTRQAAYLHDIGKIGVAESILHKPARLTDDEYEIVKEHVTIGAGILQIGQSLRHLAPLIQFHHERWDGNGYPNGLRGEGIPIESRILAICDSVEAMASDRPYQKALSLDAIMTEIQRCSGSQFDPKVVDVFCQLLQEYGDDLVVNSARTEYMLLHRQPKQRMQEGHDTQDYAVFPLLFPAEHA
ncbi:MAG: diguanylate cyclase [Chloroflexota bacterium]